MFSVKSLHLTLLCLSLALSACGSDLNPSGTDLRPPVTAGSIGNQVSQQVAPFSLLDSRGNPWRLTDHLPGGTAPADAIVLYFTMWCPICLSHSDHMLSSIIPAFAARGNVQYVLIDYISGSVVGGRASELANGYGGSPFTVLVDSGQSLMTQLNAAMGSTIVINNSGVILMNEDYRNGVNLTNVLNGVIP